VGEDAIVLANGNAATHHPVLSLFTELLAVLAPSGREDQIAGIVRDKLDGRVCWPKTLIRQLSQLSGVTTTYGLSVKSQRTLTFLDFCQLFMV
jgi:hypothetical protein